MAVAAASCSLLTSAAWLVVLTAALVANPPRFPDGTEFTVRRLQVAEPDAPAQASELRITGHVVRLRREDSVSMSSVYVQAMRKQAWARTERDVRLNVR